MCRSVPQIEAACTATSTSFGPGSGTGGRSRLAPLVACVFIKACMVRELVRGLVAVAMGFFLGPPPLGIGLDPAVRPGTENLSTPRFFAGALLFRLGRRLLLL